MQYSPKSAPYRFRNRDDARFPDSPPTPITDSFSLSAKLFVFSQEINSVTRRKVVTPDARNHGDSPHAAAMSHALLAADLKHLLLKSPDLPGAPLDRVSLLGHGMGGRAGMILALTEPGLVDKLVCVEATPAGGAGGERWARLKEAGRILLEMEPVLRATKGMERRSVADSVSCTCTRCRIAERQAVIVVVAIVASIVAFSQLFSQLTCEPLWPRNWIALHFAH